MASNMLKIYEEEFKGLTQKEHMDKVYGVTGMMISEFIQGGLNNNITSPLLVAMTSVAVLSDKNKTISENEKKLINKIFKSMVEDMDGLYKDISISNSSDFDLIKKIVSVVGKKVTHYMLLYMLGFASIDGNIDAKFEKKIDEIFGMHFLQVFIDSGAESVPDVAIEINEFEDEIIKYIKRNKGILPLKKICSHFKDKTEKKMKTVLDSLCDREVLYGGDSLFECSYGVLDVEVRVVGKNKKSNSTNKKKEVINKKVKIKEKEKELQIEDDEEKKDEELNSQEEIDELLENIDYELKAIEKYFDDEVELITETIYSNEYETYDDVKYEIEKVNRIVDKTGRDAERLLAKLDKKGQKFLEKKKEHYYVKQLFFKVEKIYEYIDSLSSCFNDNATGEAFSEYKYKISNSTKSIKVWWEYTYEGLPETIELKKAKYEKELKEWREKVKEIEKLRVIKKQEYAEKLKNEYNENKEKKQKEHELHVMDLEKVIKDLRNELENKKKEIENLKIFAIVKKISLNIEIEEIERKITEIEEEKIVNEEIFEEELKEQEERYNEEKNNIQNKVYKEYPLPNKPKEEK